MGVCRRARCLYRFELNSTENPPNKRHATKRRRCSRYPIRRHTVHLKIQYFVREKFEAEYQGSLARLENSVEEDYIAVMRQNCYRERNYRKSDSLNCLQLVWVFNPCRRHTPHTNR